MTLHPLLQASCFIQIHVLAAILAALLGAVVLFRRKGTSAHRLSGRIWVLLMVITALSSFAIQTINSWGPWSFIHLISIGTLIALVAGIALAQNHQITAHRTTMRSTYAGGLLIAGTLSFMPGRIMHAVVFGPDVDGPAVPAGTTPAPNTTNVFVAIMENTPLWVWPLFAGLLLLGCRDRIIRPWQLFAAPAVVAALSLYNLMSAGLFLSAFAGFALGVVPGAYLGDAFGRRDRLAMREGGRIAVPGEWLSMAVLLGVFVLRYANGFVTAMAPDMRHDPVWLASCGLLSGLLAALVVARCRAQWRQLSPEASLSRA
ncbi:MAG: DUF2306 domain-containing protein [Rhizobiaceae bacterium]|nr:DUF2306 domain-containing protein [Rhizobiaceae bacterium]